MSIFLGMNINATALTAERLRMDIISKNIANYHIFKYNLFVI